MDRATSFHEDVFYEYFRPFRHPDAKFNIWGGDGLETFGSDLAIAVNYSQDFVWTVLDCDGDQWIVPEMHYVNRVCYLLTERPHCGAPIEFRVARYPSTLTPMGLTRRMTALKAVMDKQMATRLIANV